MSPLRRVLGAPGLWVGLCVLKLALALVLARPVRAALEGAMGRYTRSGPVSELLTVVAQLVNRHESIAYVAVESLIAAAVLGTLLWIFVAGGVITRLARPRPLADTLGAALLYTPKVALVTVYMLIPRGLVVIAAVNDPLGISNFWGRALLLWIGWTWCTLALDLARARIILRGAKTLHPGTVIAALLDVVAHRRVVAAAGVALLGGATAAGTLMLGLWQLGAPWVLWAARGLAVLGVGLMLWRVAFAVAAAVSTDEAGEASRAEA